MLMKTKPLSRTEAYFFHVRLVPKPADQSSLPTAFVGLVVPKKVHALAVDRNRIRRIIRAQCRLAFQALDGLPPLHDVHCLFRVKVLPKQTLGRGTKPQLNAAYLNPHSKQFTHLVQTMLAQALSRLLREHQAAHPVLGDSA